MSLTRIHRALRHSCAVVPMMFRAEPKRVPVYAGWTPAASLITDADKAFLEGVTQRMQRQEA